MEDRARGIQRNPLELITADLDPQLEPVVLWLAGSIHNDVADGDVIQLMNRAERWPILQSAMQAGLVFVDEHGRLSHHETLPEPFTEVLPARILAENQDRLELASLLLIQLDLSLTDQAAIDLLCGNGMVCNDAVIWLLGR